MFLSTEQPLPVWQRQRRICRRLAGSCGRLSSCVFHRSTGCAYCVDLHTIEARHAGETTQRLDCLTVWREVQFFDDAEKAALEWAEAITKVATNGAPEHLYNSLSDHFSENEIVDLTLIIAQMNAWNRLAISFGHGPDARTE